VDVAISGDRNVIKKEAENITWATFWESMQSRNDNKQPYWALRTYFRKS